MACPLAAPVAESQRKVLFSWAFSVHSNYPFGRRPYQQRARHIVIVIQQRSMQPVPYCPSFAPTVRLHIQQPSQREKGK